MLGRWRLALRQAEEAARAGRLEEAIGYTLPEDVADHRRLIQLRARLVADLVGRARRRLEAEDFDGAMDDLALAEKSGAPPDDLAPTRLAIARLLLPGLRRTLASGDPVAVAERLAHLERRRITGLELVRLKEIASVWHRALAAARRAEFAEARDLLDRALRLVRLDRPIFVSSPLGQSGSGSPPSPPTPTTSATPAVCSLATSEDLSLEAPSVHASGEDPMEQVLLATRREWDRRCETLATQIETLRAALAAERWMEAVVTAEAILELAPDHPTARQHRDLAARMVGGAAEARASSSGSRPRGFEAIGKAQVVEATRARLGRTDVSPRSGPHSSDPTPGSGDTFEILWLDETPRLVRPRGQRRGYPHDWAIPGGESGLRPTIDRHGPHGRLLLWADGVGGHLVCLDDHVVLGRATPDGLADVPLIPPTATEPGVHNDLAEQHAVLTRDDDTHWIKALHPVRLNGRLIESSPLKDRDRIVLGRGVELEYRKPNPLSVTARLRVEGRTRLPRSLRGAILMGDHCLVGGVGPVHIESIPPSQPWTLYRHDGVLWCRSDEAFRVDGGPPTHRAPLTTSSTVIGDLFSLKLEPLKPRAALTQ